MAQGTRDRSSPNHHPLVSVHLHSRCRLTTHTYITAYMGVLFERLRSISKSWRNVLGEIVSTYGLLRLNSGASVISFSVPPELTRQRKVGNGHSAHVETGCKRSGVGTLRLFESDVLGSWETTVRKERTRELVAVACVVAPG